MNKNQDSVLQCGETQVEEKRQSTQMMTTQGNDQITAASISVQGEYPRSWTKDPLRPQSNMYASRLSQMLQRNAVHGKYRSASKSQVQLVHTLSIYGQINVPICEINRLYGLTPNNQRAKRSQTADGKARGRNSSAQTPLRSNFKPKNSYISQQATQITSVSKGSKKVETDMKTKKLVSPNQSMHQPNENIAGINESVLVKTE